MWASINAILIMYQMHASILQMTHKDKRKQWIISGISYLIFDFWIQNYKGRMVQTAFNLLISQEIYLTAIDALFLWIMTKVNANQCHSDANRYGHEPLKVCYLPVWFLKWAIVNIYSCICQFVMVFFF